MLLRGKIVASSLTSPVMSQAPTGHLGALLLCHNAA